MRIFSCVLLVAAGCGPVFSNAPNDSGAADSGPAEASAVGSTGNADGMSADAADASKEAGADMSVCVPGATQCSGLAVETCGQTGQWESPVACGSSECVGGSCTVITSCASGGAGMTDCGANSENCCTSLEVPGGTYYRTYTNSGGGPNDEADPATVAAFRLDKYLVTVGRFRQFVGAWSGGGGYTPVVGSGKHAHLNGGQGLANGADPGTYEMGWVASDDSNIAPTGANLVNCASDPDAYATWTPSVGSNETLPINCVNWWEAYAFCIWDGGFLPSEAEWEYVSAAGGQQREYPWGTTAPGTASLYAIYGPAINECYYPNASGTCTGVSNIAPVGTATLGAGLWGQMDMAGDVYEWTLDWYAATYANPCTNCGYLTPASFHSFRGGCFNLPPTYFLSAYRYPSAPAPRGNNIGFRCARTP